MYFAIRRLYTDKGSLSLYWTGLTLKIVIISRCSTYIVDTCVLNNCFVTLKLTWCF